MCGQDLNIYIFSEHSHSILGKNWHHTDMVVHYPHARPKATQMKSKYLTMTNCF